MIVKPRTPTERLLWAYQFGHGWSRDPKYANLRNLDIGRILKMTGDEDDARLLIGSWQDFEPEVANLVKLWYGRELEPDGRVGPVTEFVMDLKRCGMTDFAPPANADLSTSLFDIPDLLGALRSYQRFADFKNDGREYVGGSGSWPKCDPEHKDVHSVRMNVILSGFSSHQKAQWPIIAPKMSSCSAEVGLHTRFIFDGDPKAAEHDVRGQNINGSVIGFAYFNNPDTCQKGLVARIDNTFNVDEMTFGELNEHEEGGHSRGLEHVSRQNSEAGEEGYSIMHSSIGRPKRWMSWLKDRHFPTMKRYFGGVAIPTNPTPQPNPPGPGPTPQPGRASIRGTLTVEVGGKSVGNFIVVPASEV